jgi:hypothetical protein
MARGSDPTRAWSRAISMATSTRRRAQARQRAPLAGAPEVRHRFDQRRGPGAGPRQRPGDVSVGAPAPRRGGARGRGAPARRGGRLRLSGWPLAGGREPRIDKRRQRRAERRGAPAQDAPGFGNGAGTVEEGEDEEQVGGIRMERRRAAAARCDARRDPRRAGRRLGPGPGGCQLQDPRRRAAARLKDLESAAGARVLGIAKRRGAGPELARFADAERPQRDGLGGGSIEQARAQLAEDRQRRSLFAITEHGADRPPRSGAARRQAPHPVEDQLDGDLIEVLQPIDDEEERRFELARRARQLGGATHAALALGGVLEPLAARPAQTLQEGLPAPPRLGGLRAEVGGEAAQRGARRFPAAGISGLDVDVEAAHLRAPLDALEELRLAQPRRAADQERGRRASREQAVEEALGGRLLVPTADGERRAGAARGRRRLAPQQALERLEHGRARCEARLGIERQTPQHHVVEAFGQLGAELRRRRGTRRPRRRLAGRGAAGGAGARQAAGRQAVEGDAERVDVGPRAQSAAAGVLRSQEGEGSLEALVPVRPQPMPAEPEVDEDGGARPIALGGGAELRLDDVRRLDVEMEKVAGVKEAERLGELPGEGQDLAGGERRLQPAQRRAIDELAGEERPLAAVAEVVGACDARVRDLREQRELALDLLQVPRAARRLVEQLQRHVFAAVEVADQEDPPHAAGAQLAPELVARSEVEPGGPGAGHGRSTRGDRGSRSARRRAAERGARAL